MPQASENILRRLQLPVVRRLEGLLQGDYRSPSRGDGLDLADLREYQFHDDVRRIDWNATARLGEPYVRDYLEDREISVWFLLDMSPSMHFEGVSVSKHTVLVEFTTLMCRLLLGRGNRTGAMIFSGRIDRLIPANGGRRQLLHILNEVANHRPSPGSTDLKQVLKEAAGAIRRRSLVFVVSDFISVPGWEESLTPLAMRHDVIAVRLTDPLEARMPDLGFLTFQDAETGEQLFVDTHARNFRARFAAAADARENALRSAFERSGVDVLELATEDDVIDASMRFADMRKQSLRRPA
ncbi:MAG TPA: DUF58 domain-containing protein [Rhizomicrobium sp.]|nr:DUF58 domain-containing protein [Rhizomicrobium sp.]